ncbi:MAG: hypothetical protein SF029_02755 [bacterium]|nr:hypothetical protein [bacterium]
MRNRLLALMILLVGVLWLENRRQRQTIVQLEAVKAEYDAEKRREAEIEHELDLYDEFSREYNPEAYAPLPLRSPEVGERLKKQKAMNEIRSAIREHEYEKWKERKNNA